MSAWTKSIIRVIYVVCDKCSSGCDDHAATTAGAIESAKARGWSCIKGEIVCPECQQESKCKA